jgi:hypothetical protein
MRGVPVEVCAQKIAVPYFCPCCCGVADTALAVSFTQVTGERFRRETTRELDFPYCSRCVRHARFWTAAWRAAAVVMACGALAGVVAGIGFGLPAGAGVAAGAGALAVALGFALRAKARATRCPACAGAGPAVTFHGWVDQVQTFSFVSRRYAAAFAEQNERSLVNVTPHLYQLLEQQRVSVSPAAAARAHAVRATPMWPQRVDRARSLLGQVMRANGNGIHVDGMAKRPGRAS